MGTIVFQLVIAAASTAYQMKKQKKAEQRAAAAADKRKGFNVTVSGEARPLPICYGKNILGGIETKHKVSANFVGSYDNSDKTFADNFSNSGSSGTKNEFLNVQYALCHSGIEGVQWAKVNGQHYDASVAKFKHLIRTHNESRVDNIATANGIPSTNVFTDTAHASATFRLNRDEANYQGVPSMEFLIKGQKVNSVYTDGSGGFSLSNTKSYSNNPALCLLDYLMNSTYGRGLPVNDIDLGSFYHAAQVCDTVVATDRTVGGKVNGQKEVITVADEGSRPTDLEDQTYENTLYYTTSNGKYWYWNRTAWVETTLTATRPIPLYECNIALDSSSKIRDNIEAIMSCMNLAELTWSSEGKYKLLLEYPSSESDVDSYIDTAHYFTDDDIIRDSFDISWNSATERLNQVTVSFPNEHEDFKDDSVTWPKTGSTAHDDYLEEDNDQPFQSQLQPQGVTDPYHAIAMAEAAVRKARSIYTVSLTVSKKGLSLEPGDFININSLVAGVDDENFRIESIEINADFTVKITAYKFDHTVLAWNVADDIAYVNKPTYDFTVDAPTNLAFTANAADIISTSPGKLTWTAANDISATKYLVEVMPNGGNVWTTLNETRGTSSDVVGLKSGNYDFSVRSVSNLGKKSDRLIIQNQAIELITVGTVLVVYGDSANIATNNQSLTIGTNTFVAYYPYTGDEPTLPIRSGIEFVSFVGANGADGAPGADGVDGAPGADGADGADGNDGDVGDPAPRFAQLKVYSTTQVTTAPTTPSANWTWSTGAYSGLTAGWGISPPTQSGTTPGSVWISTITFHDSTGSATSTSATGIAPVEGISFSGLVSFNSSNGTFADSSGTNVTNIDGGSLQTGTVTADVLKTGNLTSSATPTGNQEGAFFASDGTMAIGDSKDFIQWDGTTLTVAGIIRNLSESKINAESVSNNYQVVRNTGTSGNQFNLDGAGVYVMILVGHGGGGGRGSYTNSNGISGGFGGGGGGLAKICFDWDGTTPITYTAGNNNGNGQVGLNSNGSVDGNNSNSSTLAIGNTVAMTANGGGGGKGEIPSNNSITYGAGGGVGGTAVVSNVSGIDYITSYSHSGGAGGPSSSNNVSTWGSGGGGANFFGGNIIHSNNSTNNGPTTVGRPCGYFTNAVPYNVVFGGGGGAYGGTYIETVTENTAGGLWTAYHTGYNNNMNVDHTRKILGHSGPGYIAVGATSDFSGPVSHASFLGGFGGGYKNNTKSNVGPNSGGDGGMFGGGGGMFTDINTHNFFRGGGHGGIGGGGGGCAGYGVASNNNIGHVGGAGGPSAFIWAKL